MYLNTHVQMYVWVRLVCDAFKIVKNTSKWFMIEKQIRDFIGNYNSSSLNQDSQKTYHSHELVSYIIKTFQFISVPLAFV